MSKLRFCFILLVVISAVSVRAVADDLYVDLEDVPNPTFEELLDPAVSPTIPDGETFYGPVYGSTIDVMNSLVEGGPYGTRAFETNIKIHTLCNSVIGRSSFYKWTRWYQEDGDTQIFRLFTGERNTRNDREGAARVEAFSAFKWGPGVGPWNEWTGRYTIVKPHGCAIFQAKNNINDWGIMLNLSSSGDITLNHRRHQEDYVIARNMTGKSFDIRVLDNGRDYMVWLNGELVGTGYYDRPEGETGFRWGMYDGTIQHAAMIFVSGATVRADVDPNEPYIDDNEPPAPPTGLSVNAGSGIVSLDWNDNTENDLAGYKVYRSDSQSGPFSPIDVIVGNSYYEDNLTGRYFYYVTAVDFASNESSGSNLASDADTADAGADMITWSGEGVDLAPSYSEGFMPSFWTWSAEPADGVEFYPNAYVENPTVTITKATDNPSTVTLTLSANDGIGPVTDTMTIDVYDDACKATVAVGGVLDPADINADCIVNIKDLALMAETWFVDISLPGPVVK